MKRLAAPLVLGLALVACGGGATSTFTAPAARGTSPSAPAGPQRPGTPAASVLPSVEVIDVATGAKINLASLVPSPKPLLLWFWAPH